MGKELSYAEYTVLELQLNYFTPLTSSLKERPEDPNEAVYSSCYKDDARL